MSSCSFKRTVPGRHAKSVSSTSDKPIFTESYIADSFGESSFYLVSGGSNFFLINCDRIRVSFLYSYSELRSKFWFLIDIS